MSFTSSWNSLPLAVSFFEPGLVTWQLVQAPKVALRSSKPASVRIVS